MITYWTQPYPKTIEDAQQIATELRCAGGTFSNDLVVRDPLSMDAIRAARDDLNARIRDRLAEPIREPRYGYEIPHLDPSSAAWRVLEALSEDHHRRIERSMLSYFVDDASVRVPDPDAVRQRTPGRE